MLLLLLAMPPLPPSFGLMRTPLTLPLLPTLMPTLRLLRT